MTKIKICGLTREENIDAVNALRPEYVGFVFARGSKREIDFNRAEDLSKKLRQDITPVGVFVDAAIGDIAECVRRGIVRAVQLHGHEDCEYISRLKSLADVPVIQAFVVRSASDLRRAEKSVADCVLLDGGTGGGAAFDHTLITSFSRPFFLAGGLNPENVRNALGLRPYAVDVSTGVETGGKKDFNKIRALISAVRSYKE